MPNNRGRTKRDDATALLQTPAKIDIVAGLVIFGIEAADIFERPAVKRHVTSRNVLGDNVRKQHVRRSAGRAGHASLDPIFRRRRHIRSADARVIAANERAD